MGKHYNQLSLYERQKIEQGLNDKLSVRQIARLIDRSPSTISREIKTNRSNKGGKGVTGLCRERAICTKKGICTGTCKRPHTLCCECPSFDCRDICGEFISHTACTALTRFPWVCNGCPKIHYGCRRTNRLVYKASVADKIAQGRRSDSREGVAVNKSKMLLVLTHIKESLQRGLSPYEIATLYKDKVGVSYSTLYRWIQKGYGGLSNMDLERKVRFRPRKYKVGPKTTSHTKKRNYESFNNLDEEVRLSAAEMDCVIGRAQDTQCVLTLYLRPSHLQIALLLERKDCQSVARAITALRQVCDPDLFEELFPCVLTDNGPEFNDEDMLGALFGEQLGKTSGIKLFYCDPRRSDQKGGCEKNHTELRQILKKGLFVFDELTGRDLAVLMSHANSNPRASLCNMSPIEMFKNAYGQAGQDLLDALGIEEIGRDELNLTPAILDIERKRRGEAPLTKLK